MRSHFFLPLLLGAAIASPTPQDINLAAVDAAPDPVFTAAPFDVQSDTPPVVAPAPVTPIEKRNAPFAKRGSTCTPQPKGSGPVASPDTPEGFENFYLFSYYSNNAITPDGYSKVFTNLKGSLEASKYMGLYTLNSYDTFTCASKCDQASGCEAFNLYIERDPSVDPNSKNCSNPPSTTNYKCTLWGASVAAGQATNLGQYRGDFHVVITGSNGYNKVAPPPGVPGYTGPVELGGAINAPLDAQGHNTYIGFKYFPFSQGQGYDPNTCANACNVQSAYNKAHPASDGSYMTCVFFNAYVLSQNGIPQGLYCSLYNETWAPSYGTNYGQYRGYDRYTVSRSYSYSLIATNATTTTPTNPSSCPTSGAALLNGNFEDPRHDPVGWSFYNMAGSTNYGPVSPGSPAGGSYGFAAFINPGGNSQDVSGLTMETVLNICPGRNYSVQVDYRFDNAANNGCTFTMKYPYKDSSNFGSIIVGSAVSGYQTGTWSTEVGTFQAVSGKNLFIMDFRCKGGIVEDISVDNIRVLPYAGNAF